MGKRLLRATFLFILFSPSYVLNADDTLIVEATELIIH